MQIQVSHSFLTHGALTHLTHGVPSNSSSCSPGRCHLVSSDLGKQMHSANVT